MSNDIERTRSILREMNKTENIELEDLEQHLLLLDSIFNGFSFDSHSALAEALKLEAFRNKIQYAMSVLAESVFVKSTLLASLRATPLIREKINVNKFTVIKISAGLLLDTYHDWQTNETESCKLKSFTQALYHFIHDWKQSKEEIVKTSN